jgi:GNAT superfamily N-acetyltransferase
MPAEPAVPLQPADQGALEELVALCAAYGRALRGRALAPARIAQRLETPGLRLADDARACYLDGRLAGWVQVWREATGTRLGLWGVVHPERIGRGIGSALVRWGVARAHELAQSAPAGQRVALRSELMAADPRTLPLFTGLGFRLIHQYQEWRVELVGPPAAPAVPLGIRVRTALPSDDLAAIAWARSQALRDHWDYVERSPAEELAQIQALAQAPGLQPQDWFLAYEREELAGMALCHSRTVEDANTAWVHTLCVRRHWRERGIGLALLQQAIRAYYERGKIAVGAGVATRRAAGDSSLYERAGMQLGRVWHVVELEIRPGVEA